MHSRAVGLFCVIENFRDGFSTLMEGVHLMLAEFVLMLVLIENFRDGFSTLMEGVHLMLAESF